MDLMYRNQKYKEYLKKIKLAGSEVQDKMFQKNIKEKAEHTLQILKADEDSSSYNLILWLLVVPLILVIIVAIIGSSSYYHLIPLILLLAYLIYYRSAMISATKQATNLKINLDSVNSENSESTWLKQKIEYILLGLNIKRTRIKLVKNLYVLFFPILLFYLYWLFFGEPAFNNTLVALLVAYLLGSTIWVFFFGDDIEYFESIDANFKEDLNKLMLLN